MKTFFSIAVSFAAWMGLFFIEVWMGLTPVWGTLFSFFIAIPLSRWVARKVTGIDPVLALFP
ncbi:hypothetical protein QU487_06370 [Crenobacter sp. SG2305]|uniref:hypothetical protein n=1 Tax=Crenobacter oryzisoli TaxID=3056844 RepID=UPI0025AB4F3A|nr:hypothetical protein [Crenobacter sp. SG2305]MDN0082377.1 hypothetical protein [Crenobacter sp. SG2305]